LAESRSEKSIRLLFMLIGMLDFIFYFLKKKSFLKILAKKRSWISWRKLIKKITQEQGIAQQREDYDICYLEVTHSNPTNLKVIEDLYDR